MRICVYQKSRGEPGLGGGSQQISEFRDSQGLLEKPCLEKPKQTIEVGPSSGGCDGYRLCPEQESLTKRWLKTEF